MAATSQHPQYEQIADIMHEMKRTAQDLLGEAPLTPLTNSPNPRAPSTSYHLSSPWATPPHSTFNSPLNRLPAPSVIVEPVLNNHGSVADNDWQQNYDQRKLAHSLDTEHTLAIVRSYRSPSVFLDGGMISDELPPSPETRACNQSEDIVEHQQPRPSTKPGDDVKPRLSLSLKSIPPPSARTTNEPRKPETNDLRHSSNNFSNDASKKKEQSTSEAEVKRKSEDQDVGRNLDKEHDRDMAKRNTESLDEKRGRDEGYNFNRSREHGGVGKEREREEERKGQRGRELERKRDREQDRERDQDRNRDREQNREKDRERKKEERERDRKQDQERKGDRERELERKRERERRRESDRAQHDRNRGRDRNHVRSRDFDRRCDREADTADSGRDSDREKDRDRSRHRNNKYDRNRDSDVDDDHDHNRRPDKDRDRNRSRNHERSRNQENDRERDRDRNRNRKRDQDRANEFGRKVEERGKHGYDARDRDREHDRKRNRSQDRLRERTRERDYEKERGEERDFGTPQGRARKGRSDDRDPSDKSHNAVKERSYRRDRDPRRGREHRQDRERRGSTKHDARADAMSESDASSDDSMESDVVTPTSSKASTLKKRRRPEDPSTSRTSRYGARESPSKKVRRASHDKASGIGADEGSERTVPRVVLRIPSKHVVNNSDKASSSSKSQDNDKGGFDGRSERRRSSSKHRKIPDEVESRGIKRRAERNVSDERDGIDRMEGESRPAKRLSRDDGRYESKSAASKSIAPQTLRSERPKTRKEETEEDKDSSARADLSKGNTPKDRRPEGPKIPKNNGSRDARVALRSEQASTSRATFQRQPAHVNESAHQIDEDMYTERNSDQEHRRGRNRGYNRDRRSERTQDYDANKGKDHRKDVEEKDSERKGHDVNKFSVGEAQRKLAQEKAPSSHRSKETSKESRDQSGNQARNTESEKIRNARDSTAQKGEADQEPVKGGKPNEAGEKKKPFVLGIRSKPVNFAKSGQGIIPTSNVVSPMHGTKFEGAREINADSSPVMNRGAASGQHAASASMGARSQHASLPAVKAKAAEMHDSYKKSKENCKKLLEKKEYDLYEAAAKDCVRFYMQWVLSLETELRLSEAELRQGNSAEHHNRRRHVVDLYRYMANHLIPSRIQDLEGMNRHQSTHYFSRMRQKVYMRLFYLQRVWNRVVKSRSDALCKTVSDVCKEKQAGDKVELTLEYEQMTEIRDMLLQYQNNINIAEQIVSDNGDGHEEAGGECTIC